MITLERLEEPDVLKKNREGWTAEFLEEREKSPGNRPRSNRYAHPEIKSTLATMSFHKCFYCEQSVKSHSEVDHYIEVTDDAYSAYKWENLYLSCCDCNRRKAKNSSIPVAACVNPCDPKEQPSKHLAFDDECISARDNSEKGLKTIQKYKLDRTDLDYKRLKQLQLFNRALDRIRSAQISERRQPMTEREVELLRHFRQADHPFSLMFFYYLEKLGL